MFEQYLYTDNRQGGGLSVLNKSRGLSTTFTGCVNRYTDYKTFNNQSPELLVDAYRFNNEFANAPMLMNTAFLGQNITTKRNGNFVAHTLVSTEPLKGYAVDYFSNQSLFVHSFAKEDVDGTKQHTTPLPTIEDSDVFINPSFDEIIDKINSDIDFFLNLMQAVVEAIRYNKHVFMKNYKSPLEIMKMLYYVLPVDIANQITFDTRVTESESDPIIKDIKFECGDSSEIRRCKFYFIETVNFFDSRLYIPNITPTVLCIFENNKANRLFSEYYGFIEWLKRSGGVTKEKISELHRFISDKGIERLTDLADVSITELDNYMLYGKDLSHKDVFIGISPDSKKGFVKNDDSSTKIKPQKAKRKFKLSILNVLLALILIGAAIFGISMIPKNNEGEDIDIGGIVNNDDIVIVIGNNKMKLSEWSLKNIPVKEGYIFDGYVDEKGNYVINADGKVNKKFNSNMSNEIVLTEKWLPKDNNITIYSKNGSVALTLTCKTGSDIIINEQDLSILQNSADKHMEFLGLALTPNGEPIYKKSFDGVYRFDNPFGIMSSDAYEEGIEKSAITLYPIYDILNMEFTFKDYYTNQIISVENIKYSENGDVPFLNFLDKHPEYDDCSIYIQENGFDSLTEVYNKSDKWFGQQGKLNCEKYDSGKIVMIVSRKIKVYWADSPTTVSVNYGDDLVELAKEKMAEHSYLGFKEANAVYYKVGNSKELIFTNDSSEILSAMSGQNSVTIYPVYEFKFNFNTYNLSAKEYKPVEELSSIARVKFNLTSNKEPTVDYFGYDEEYSINSLTYNGFEIGTVSTQRWINNRQIGEYTAVDGCYFYEESRGNNLSCVLENSSLNSGVSIYDLLQEAFLANGSINLYIAYNPSKISLNFDNPLNQSDKVKNIVFGDSFTVPACAQAPWGYKYVNWNIGNRTISERTNLIVDFDFLVDVEQSDGVIFEAIKKAYKFNINVVLDDDHNYIYPTETGESIKFGDEWRINGVSAQTYYQNNYYNKPYRYIASVWNNDWVIVDSSNIEHPIELTNGILKITENKFGDVVEFDDINQVININIKKKIKNITYKIVFNTEALVVDKVSYNSIFDKVSYGQTKNLSDTDYKENEPITVNNLKGSIEIYPITVIKEEWLTDKEYRLIAWRIGDLEKEYKDKIVYSNVEGSKVLTINMNEDKSLEELYDMGSFESVEDEKNGICTVTVTPIFCEEGNLPDKE